MYQIHLCFHFIFNKIEASVTNKTMFSIITTILVVVGTYPKLNFKRSSKRHPLCITIMLAYSPGGYSSKRQAPDVTALPNSQCVIALLPKSNAILLLLLLFLRWLTYSYLHVLSEPQIFK